MFYGNLHGFYKARNPILLLFRKVAELNFGSLINEIITCFLATLRGLTLIKMLKCRKLSPHDIPDNA